jgi:mRNA interferase RelE/StbE
LSPTIAYKSSVEKDLKAIDPAMALRILRKVEKVLKLSGHQGTALSGELAGLYRLRAGDYRVIYSRTESGYLVLRIGHRREVYRKGRPA